MSLPPDESAWSGLSAADKRARVLSVAGELFAREGVAFPMPELAKALGIGVGSLYRQFGTKDDVLAALVVERLDWFDAKFNDAAGSDDPTGALLRVISETFHLTIQDRIAKISFELALDRPEVAESRARTVVALQRLVDEAKAVGGVRADADVLDLRIMFRLAREAEQLAPGGGARLVQLVVDGLRSPGTSLDEYGMP